MYNLINKTWSNEALDPFFGNFFLSAQYLFEKNVVNAI